MHAKKYNHHRTAHSKWQCLCKLGKYHRAVRQQTGCDRQICPFFGRLGAKSFHLQGGFVPAPLTRALCLDPAGSTGPKLPL